MAKATKKTESAETPEKKPAAKTPAKASKPAPAAKSAGPAPAAAPAAEKKPAAKKAPAKAAKKSAPPAMAGSTPLIDTNLAAQNAAAMLLNRGSATAGVPQAGKESSAFKSLKDQIARPKPTGLSNLFGPGSGSQKPAGHFNAHQQKGHNQTFGGGNKTGVPRRTNG